MFAGFFTLCITYPIGVEPAMNKTTTFTFRLKPEVKQQSIELFDSLGITLSDAINLFLHQAVKEGGLPFEVKREKAEQDTGVAS